MAPQPAQIKHIAIVTDNYTLLARFYEAIFGMWTFPGRVEAAAMGVSDGHVGLNFNLRPPGRQAGIDHYGFEVEDVEETLHRASKFRGVRYLKRPSNRPFAGVSVNDPAGNVFDLGHAEEEKKDSVYGKDAQARKTPSFISHFMLRVVDPEPIAAFYSEVFALKDEGRSNNDPNFYLSDGQVTMVIAPWKVTDYAGTGVARPAMDHLGFTVENLAAFQTRVRDLAAANVALTGPDLSATKENVHRCELLKQCSLGTLQLADPDGNLIDVSEAV